MRDILNSFSQLQRLTTENSSGTLSLDLKSWKSFYEIEQLPNDGDEESFGIGSSVDTIQAYASHQWSSFSRMPKEWQYSLSQEDKVSWGKLYESVKVRILGDAKTPHKPSNHVNFHYVTLGHIIKAGYHNFDFCETPNRSSNNNLTDKDYNTDNNSDTPMILTKLSKMYKVYTEDIRKVISNPNLSSTKGMKEINIDWKMYHQVNT